MNSVFQPPQEVLALMQQLEDAGHCAYAVGGCVRDSLLGRSPHDWDICTDALPGQMKELFAGRQLILSGEKHGTVAVVLHGQPYEITTFRVDGNYADHRHPGSVQFVPRVEQDLARRDFTINAMAWHPKRGLVDVFGGQQDLQNGIVRCVGEAKARFEEDALRILRALRFAAQLGFRLEESTAQAAAELKMTVAGISAERCFSELDKLLKGPAAGQVLARHGEVLTGVLPEIEPCIGCEQTSPWHCFDVWQHTAKAVEALPTEAPQAVRWAMLLHDLAKPTCKSMGEDGYLHFYGHNQLGGKLARQVLTRLKAPRALTENAVRLVSVHDMPLPETDADILRLMAKNSPQFLENLVLVKQADLAAHAPGERVQERQRKVIAFRERSRWLAEHGCYSLSQLQVTGVEVMDCGISAGPKVGQCLLRLLDAVMAGTLPNEKEALLQAVRRGSF